MINGRKQAFGHVAILASAGSGKTTRLIHRYIRLLADRERGVAPERICALTFTRKAAGEIFDRVVECLCDGAEDGAAAASLAGRIAEPRLDEREFGRILGLFLDNLHRAVIGTMDSFMFGVARTFPFELGIPVEFAAADAAKAEGRGMRQDILADILGVHTAAAKFLEAFKKATFGVEEKSVEGFLDRFVEGWHLFYRCCPDRRKWGDPRLIWPDKGPPTRIYGADELSVQAKIVRQWIVKQREEGVVRDRFLDKLDAITGALAAHGMAAQWSGEFAGKMFVQLLDKLDELENGSVSVNYYNDTEIAGSAARALAVLMGNLVAVEIRRALETTAGMRDLLETYDRVYEKVSRESGRFSFIDIQYLLALGDITRNAAAISRTQGEGRLFIDYRMDSRLDHWLLDEFQDTSDLQWAVFRNLLSELVQDDPDGRERSFFYVGDVKQSVYRWRGGNPGLFMKIKDRYNRAGEVIRLEQMSKTYRCSPPVVEAVNKVFAELPRELLPEDAVSEWSRVWSDHEPADKAARGYAALLQHASIDEDGSEKKDAEARYLLVADLLKEIRPVDRGIGVGILTRTNEACAELVDVLRRECPGVPFVHEGRAAVVKNEVAQVLLALVRLAAHPGDSFAWQYVRMSPLAAVLEEQEVTRDNIALRLLTEIEDAGFLSFVTKWGGRLGEARPLNEYGRQCLERLESAAAVFDATGSRNCNRFLASVEDYEVREEAAHGSVRIMTVHQAKGLGFDMVVLPQLQHRSRMNLVKAEWLDKDMLFAGDPFDPDWVLKSPKTDIAENDPVLGARLRRIDADHCFDGLCMLYVAMTRARKALYMIVSPASDTAAFRPASLLKLRLTGRVAPESVISIPDGDHSSCGRLYSAGDEVWYKSCPVIPVPEKQGRPTGAGAVELAERESRRQVLRRSEPSRLESFERSAAELFDPETRDVLDFGSAIHELFEMLEWLDPDSDGETIIGGWLPSMPCDKRVYEDVLKQFRNCLNSPEIRHVLSRPAVKKDLWREKSFEIVLDGKWVSGVFDRVAIARDALGRPSGATILDYKSNRGLDTEADIRNKAEHYRPQMHLYRRALSRILGLATDCISMDILFTVPARVVRL